ncbi:hypothetical protein H2248_003024 [Termitomyces sp. 'cryptogamus']|nr:hypothetical protein H2248_003024 [Termitomyces sp. 'cryptogamus']
MSEPMDKYLRDASASKSQHELDVLSDIEYDALVAETLQRSEFEAAAPRLGIDVGGSGSLLGSPTFGYYGIPLAYEARLRRIVKEGFDFPELGSGLELGIGESWNGSGSGVHHASAHVHTYECPKCRGLLLPESSVGLESDFSHELISQASVRKMRQAVDLGRGK